MIIDKKYIEHVEYLVAIALDLNKWATDLSIIAPTMDKAIKNGDMITYEKEVMKAILLVKKYNPCIADILVKALSTVLKKDIKVDAEVISIPIPMENQNAR